ncbi:hypothetical protein ACFX1T_009164 [Malus domestica]
MDEDKPRKDLEDLGSRFGSKLKLSEKELGGISIQRKDVEGALLGLQYTLIAEVQIHNVPVLSMTQAMVESIRGHMGTVKSVDKSGSRDCIGRFLRVKIKFNVHEPLMRGTFVNFPDEGRVWVDFKYKALPKYCLIYGLLGHATRVCKGSQAFGKEDGESSGEAGEGFAFKGLDALTDLRGKLLGAGASNRTPRGSNGGRMDPKRTQ